MEFRFLAPHAVSRLSSDLRLPASGREQDWELELADASRIGEFLAYYGSSSLDDDERFALLALLVASAQERLEAEGYGPWLEPIMALMRQRLDLASVIARYWSGDGEDEWEITSHLRQFDTPETH